MTRKIARPWPSPFLTLAAWLVLACATALPEDPARTVRVAGIVLKWIRTDKEANLRRAEPMIREAVKNGARIVCTTECFLDGYAIADKSIPLEKFRSLGELIPGGPYFRRLAALADELDIHLVAGMLEAAGDRRYNTAVLIGPEGRLVGKYRKQKLGHELVRNTPGYDSPVFSTPYGRLGLMICADRTVKSLVGRLCEGDVDFLICPSGGMFGPKTNDPIVQARSRENRVPIVFVHPAEFLVTGADGSILSRTILGDRLLIGLDETDTGVDRKDIFYFELPAGAVRSGKRDGESTEIIQTVRGPVPAAELGRSLVHEHIQCDFSGAAVPSLGRYDPDTVVEVMRPRVEEARQRGFRTLFDCTPAHIGRDPRVLRALAEQTGVRFVTNTGYYGAAGDKYLPEHAYRASAGELADRWVAEWKKGIRVGDVDTGIRPGFIKIGVDRGRLSAVDRKLVRAAARAHLETGLTIACHTGEATAALEVLATIREEGADPGALVIVHADGIDDEKVHLRLAAAGAWVEFDGVGGKPLEKHVRWIRALVREGHAGRLLLSHDAGWYRIGEEDGGRERIRPFTALSDQLIPALEKVALGEDLIRTLLEENPRRAFTVRIRRARERERQP